MDGLIIDIEKKIFHFRLPSGTSRGVLTEKHSWIIRVSQTERPEIIGTGECSIIPGLSPEFESFDQYETILSQLTNDPEMDLNEFPSIKFGMECALLDLKNGGKRIYFENAFSRGDLKIPINGLIWMGSPEYMRQQIETKLAEGFTTLKMKIGAIQFDEELAILREIRSRYTKDELVLRVDANGAFNLDAQEKLRQLQNLGIHSIEQPIMPGQWLRMRELVDSDLIDIALDEELIGINKRSEKIRLLDEIRPPYIILKPSLHGGVSGTKEWIELAESRDISWWITSALESNIGLNAICQLCAEFDNPLPQGLGTGSLYTDNIPSDLKVENGFIYIRRD